MIAVTLLIISMIAVAVASHTHAELASLRVKHNTLLDAADVMFEDHEARLNQIEEFLALNHEGDLNDDSN
jgi:hypothetical protein